MKFTAFEPQIFEFFGFQFDSDSKPEIFEWYLTMSLEDGKAFLELLKEQTPFFLTMGKIKYSEI